MTRRFGPQQDRPIRRTEEVPVFSGRHGTLFNDRVILPSGAHGRFLRWDWGRQGVVVVVSGNTGLAVLPVYRHAVQATSWEFPRGGVEDGEDVLDAGAREVQEELGVRPLRLRHLGVVHAETGLIANPVHVLGGIMPDDGDLSPKHDDSEGIGPPRWLAEGEIQESIAAGSIRCGITIAAFTLWQLDSRPVTTRPSERPLDSPT